MPVANIVDDNQEYFCMENVVWKKEAGKNPATTVISINFFLAGFLIKLLSTNKTHYLLQVDYSIFKALILKLKELS